MADMFLSPKLRLDRAKEHVIELETRIKTFFCNEPCPFVIKPDPEQIFKFEFIDPIPHFDAIAADAVDNLRSVLDQAWYAIAFRSEAKKREETAYFPFADNRTKFDKMIDRGCEKFPKEIISFVRALQPYKGGNNLLWALNRECVRNKHNILCWLGNFMGGWHVYHPEITSQMIISNPRWDDRNNEIVIEIIGDKTRSEYNIKLCFSEAFYGADTMAGKPAITVLRQLTSMVESILMGFEAETKRLGYI